MEAIKLLMWHTTSSPAEHSHIPLSCGEVDVTGFWEDKGWYAALQFICLERYDALTQRAGFTQYWASIMFCSKEMVSAFGESLSTGTSIWQSSSMPFQTERFQAERQAAEENQDTKYTSRQERGILPQLLGYWKSPVYWGFTMDWQLGNALRKEKRLSAEM